MTRAPAAGPSRELRAERAHAYENSRPEVRALVPGASRRVLDLGCASGALGAALKAERDCEVVGVEVDAAYAAAAERVLDRVLCEDVSRLAEDPELEARLGRFDCLIAADVLEHLVDPWTALRRYVSLLEPGGTAVVSVPNVRYWETFWALGRRGRWPRRPSGIFDATHLRWFTLADAWDLLYDAGLEVENVVPILRLRPDGSRLDARLPALAWLPGVRGFLSFQFVLSGRRER